MKEIATMGLGKVGTLVGVLLSKKYNVLGIDKQKPHYDFDLPFEVVEGDLSNEEFIRKVLEDKDAVVSALPYYLNKLIAKVAHDLGIHYFDLTEDVETTNYIRELSNTSKGVIAPQCGLAPGFIGIIGAHLTKDFYTLAFSHPNVEVITWWTMSDLDPWRGMPCGLLDEEGPLTNFMYKSDFIARTNNKVLSKYLDNPNGSKFDIAGIFNDKKNILGMMPHPERASEKLLGSDEGLDIFKSIISKMA